MCVIRANAGLLVALGVCPVAPAVRTNSPENSGPAFPNSTVSLLVFPPVRRLCPETGIVICGGCDQLGVLPLCSFSRSLRAHVGVDHLRQGSKGHEAIIGLHLSRYARSKTSRTGVLQNSPGFNLILEHPSHGRNYQKATFLYTSSQTARRIPLKGSKAPLFCSPLPCQVGPGESRRPWRSRDLGAELDLSLNCATSSCGPSSPYIEASRCPVLEIVC